MTQQIATLILYPTKFKIVGPNELAALTLGIVKSSSNSEEAKYRVEELWSSWYVPCSVTGTLVSLNSLRYWDVERQEVYSDPELVPNRFWNRKHDPRHELRVYWAKRNPERVISDVSGNLDGNC